MKNLFTFTGFIMCLLVFLGTLRGQSIEDIKADSQNYIWGEGRGMTLQSADNDALGMIISQISVQVESSYDLLQEEVVKDGRSTFREVLQGVVKTYSSATLQNTERIVVANEPDAFVFRYIRRADVEKIFAEREKKIRDFITNGLAAQENIQPSFALRYYYWALTLLRSHPDIGQLSYTHDNGNRELLNVMLHRHYRHGVAGQYFYGGAPRQPSGSAVQPLQQRRVYTAFAPLFQQQ